MKIRHFITLITCFALTGALSDMTVDVKRGQNVTLPVKTPEMREVNRVTLSRYENGTQVPIFRYCSVKEKKRGCPSIHKDRVSLQLGSESASVIILDAKAADAGTYNVEVIGNNTIEETFNVVFTEIILESSDVPSIKDSPPQDFSTVVVVIIVVVIIGVIAIIVVTVVSVCFCKKKNRKKLDFLDCTVDSEVADSQSGITGADERDTDESSEELCLVEKKPEDLDGTHPDALNLVNNNNNDDNNIINNNNDNNNNNNNKDVVIYMKK